MSVNLREDCFSNVKNTLKTPIQKKIKILIFTIKFNYKLEEKDVQKITINNQKIQTIHLYKMLNDINGMNMMEQMIKVMQ